MIEVDLGDLGLDEGGHLLIKHALAGAAEVRVRGTSITLAVDLPAWCRANGHALVADVIARSTHDRWHNYRACGLDRRGGRSATGAMEAGRTRLPRRGRRPGARAPARRQARRVGRRGGAALRAGRRGTQWDPATAIPWGTAIDHPDESRMPSSR